MDNFAINRLYYVFTNHVKLVSKLAIIPAPFPLNCLFLSITTNMGSKNWKNIMCQLHEYRVKLASAKAIIIILLVVKKSSC